MRKFLFIFLIISAFLFATEASPLLTDNMPDRDCISLSGADGKSSPGDWAILEAQEGEESEENEEGREEAAPDTPLESPSGIHLASAALITLKSGRTFDNISRADASLQRLRAPPALI